MKINIALLAGGNSSEREIALQSASQIERALDKEKYNVLTIDVKGRDWVYYSPERKPYPFDKNDFSLSINGRKIHFDYALIVIHGTPGEDGMLQGYLEMMGIPYSTCGMVSTVVTFDKITCKRAVREYGIPVAREMLLRRGQPCDPKEVIGRLGLPLFVKPNASGSSFGVTKVKSEEALLPAIDAALRESKDVLVEEFLAGREMACGILLSGGTERFFAITEIVPKNEFFDYQAKYTPGYSQEITPADVTPEVAEALHEYTVRAYRACRCRGLVRVDFIVDPEGKPYLIEINSIPGMSAGSIVPKQAEAAGLTLGELYDIIIEDTLRT